MKKIINKYTKCEICPRKCNVNRNNNQFGYCKMPSDIYIARAALHYYEEPSISFKNGSGAIFFTGCNLGCKYCQNEKISHKNYGEKISIERLAEIFLELQNNKNAENINLVTPTHYIPSIKEAIIIAKKKGLMIPIVYNTSGYESVENLKTLEGLIDIYLPDFKYYNNETALKYSKCNNYVEIVKNAINEMFRQTGKNKFTKDGKMIKGIIIRHMILPTYESESKEIIKYLYEKYKDDVYLSIMNQYTPLDHVKDDKILSQKINEEIYDNLIDFALDIGIKNAYIQEGETCKESFIPDFNLEGVKKGL